MGLAILSIIDSTRYYISEKKKTIMITRLQDWIVYKLAESDKFLKSNVFKFENDKIKVPPNVRFPDEPEMNRHKLASHNY